VLLIAMAVTFVLGLLPPLRRLLVLHLLLDVVFVAYLGLLYRAQASSAERRARVRRLHPPAPPPHRDDLLPGDERTYEGHDEDEDDDTGDSVRILEHSST
jgi:hypothetical protein